MSLATDIHGSAPAAPAVAPDADTSPSPQSQGTVYGDQAAPVTPATPLMPVADDWKSKHERLVNESIPALQSRAATERNRADKAEADLAALREEFGEPDEVRYEIASERDNAWADQIGKWLAEGATLAQVNAQVRRQISDVNTSRSQSDARRQSVDGLIGIVDTYDKPYAEFLRSMSKHGTAITQDSILALRPTFDSLKGTPAQAAAAASAAPAVPGREPPVVPQGGGAPRIGDAPVWKPGMRPRDLLKTALGGAFGTNFDRPPRRDQ